MIVKRKVNQHLESKNRQDSTFAVRMEEGWKNKEDQ
jgi:hypothetical protein